MHRPISNEYDPVANQVWHNPYFMGWFGCGECEAKRLKAWDSMPKAEKQRKIAERNRELEALGGFELDIVDDGRRSLLHAQNERLHAYGNAVRRARVLRTVVTATSHWELHPTYNSPVSGS